MYDIEELEKKWIKYRRRKIAIIVSSAILITSITGGLSYFIINTIKHKSIDKKIVDKNSNLVGKSSNIEGDIVVKREPHVKKEIAYQKSYEDTREDSISNNTHKSELNMIITSPKNGSVVKEIEKRFRESKNYDDAIYLAEYYYSHKKYKKAEYWAMQANIVDSIPEDSWIIFAKAKVKSGHRLEALKVLEAYYNKTGSTNALDLIDTIRKNRKF